MHDHDQELALETPHRQQRQAAKERDAGPSLTAAATAPPSALSSASVQRLQRAAGNQAVVQRLSEGEEERSPVLDVVGKGGGQPLPDDTRSTMESAVGADLSDVRVHTDGKAAESAASVQARAYTVGSDVVFNSGEYDPSSTEGKRTLAHELTHVVQQRNGPVDGTPAGGGIQVSDPGDKFEQAAEANADAAVNGSTPAPQPSAPAGVQRSEQEDVQTLPLQRQAEAAPEEMAEEEEPAAATAQALPLQREEAPEEEEMQAG